MPDCQRFESTDPRAQENDPAIRLIEAQNSRCPMVPDRSCGHTRTNNPRMPNRRPALPRPEMWWSPSKQGIEHEKPERGDGDDECGQARGDGEFRVRQREVAAHQEQQAHDCGQRDLLGRIENLAPGRSAHSQHDRARDRKTHARTSMPEEWSRRQCRWRDRSSPRTDTRVRRQESPSTGLGAERNALS